MIFRHFLYAASDKKNVYFYQVSLYITSEWEPASGNQRSRQIGQSQGNPLFAH